MILSVLAMLVLAGLARAEDLQKQMDDLREQLQALKQSTQPAEPVEVIKQVTEWVSPTGELFTEPQKDNVSPTDGSPLTERLTYRKMKFSRRESVSEKIDAAVAGGIDGHVIVGLNMVAVYQNLVGKGNETDMNGVERSANHGAGSGQADVTLSGKPMRNTIVFVDFNTGTGPGIDALAPNSVALNSNYLSGGNTATLREAWVAIHGPRKVISLQAGVIDLTSTFDANQFSNDETSQFLSGSLGNSPLLLQPANGPGAVLRMELSRLSAKVGVQNYVSSFTDAGDSIYAIAEIGCRFHLLADSQLRVWVRDLPYNGVAPDQALGLSADHRITPWLNAFWRYAKNSHVEGQALDVFGNTVYFDMNTYDWAASGGFELGNLSKRRLKDRIGLAYGRNVEQSGSCEEFSEVYYKTVLTPNFTISLHGQAVFDRLNVGPPADTLTPIFALGLRTQVSY
jgi:hypothetical protein